MAAIVSGACCISSNRYGTGPLGQRFGGTGFAMSVEGQQIGETSEQSMLEVVTVDLQATRAQKSNYPCYVREL
jgi:N-carbamoylputrescine amidase